MTNKEALEILRSVMPGTDNDKVFQAIQESIKALEREKVGHWKKVIDDKGFIDGNPCTFYHYECSECGRMDGYFEQNNYCPNCGARMESEEE